MCRELDSLGSLWDWNHSVLDPSFISDSIAEEKQLKGGKFGFGLWLRRHSPSWKETHYGRGQLSAEAPALEAACLHLSGPGNREKGTLTLTFLLFPFSFSLAMRMDSAPFPQIHGRPPLFPHPASIPLSNCLHRHTQKYVTLMTQAFLNVINLANRIILNTCICLQVLNLGFMGHVFFLWAHPYCQNQFLVAVGLWPLFSHWLSVKGCSQPLETTEFLAMYLKVPALRFTSCQTRSKGNISLTFWSVSSWKIPSASK